MILIADGTMAAHGGQGQGQRGMLCGAPGKKVFVILLTVLLAGTASAAEGLQPPCGIPPTPPYPVVSNVPVVLTETQSHWRPPSCVGWQGSPPTHVVAVAGRIREPGGVAVLLARFGAFSSLAGVRYWSETEQSWQTLITVAYSVVDAAGTTRRGDFRPEEMLPGVALYSAERDNRSSQNVIYRMQVLERAQDRIVVSITNVSPVSRYLVTLFAPGELQTTYFLDRLGPDDWGYYALSGATTGFLTGGHPASWINRAIAFYRHFAGIPTDLEPPAAR